MIIVSNTTPIIGLASIERLDLLDKVFRKILIPQAVYDEIIIGGRKSDWAKHDVLSASWIEVVTVKDRLAVDVLLDELDIGEAETIVLALELNADWVLMDEKKGRRKLSQLEMRKIGTLGILLKAKQLDLLSELRADLEKIRKKGFSISQRVIDEVLKAANE